MLNCGEWVPGSPRPAVADAEVRDRHYISGRWVASSSRDRINVYDSVTGTVMATVPSGTPDDVDAAVSAARAASSEWAALSPHDRGKHLRRIGEELAARKDVLAATITRETGMALKLSRAIQVGLPINSFNSAAALAESYEFEERCGNSLIVREPVGVVGCITPWNFPLHQIGAKVAYAMAAGCTVVLKPSEVAPLSAFALAEVMDAVGLPAGVFNLVTGYGPTVGEAIVAHPDVAMVSFTGSNGAGRRVSHLAADTTKRVALELGGKSANVLLDDLDETGMAKAVADGVGKAFLNSGQTCSALTRMLVPRKRLREATALAVAAAERLVVGDPTADGVHLGPLASAEQRDRVTQYIRTGIAEGAELATGGPEPLDVASGGYYVRPTVFTNVDPTSVIAQEEIFGPVLVLIPYDSDEHAVTVANDVIYGLAGGVWSSDPERARTVARRMQAGQIEINGGAFNADAPFGGFKQSGIGREHGRHGLEEFTELKSIQE